MSNFTETNIQFSPNLSLTEIKFLNLPFKNGDNIIAQEGRFMYCDSLGFVKVD